MNKQTIKRCGHSDWIRLAMLGVCLGLMLPSSARSQSAGPAYTLQTNLTVNGLTNTDVFGDAVAGDGNTLVIGNFMSAGGGEAYVFQWNGIAWAKSQQFTPTTNLYDPYEPVTNQFPGLGNAIAVDGNWMAVAADESTGTNVSGTVEYYAGAVEMFHFDGTQWSLQQTLWSPQEPSGNSFFFGYSVALHGDTLVVGDEVNHVEVFQREGMQWAHQVELVPPPDRTGGFGQSVSINENADTIVVGAPDTFTNKGAVYIFNRNGTNWLAGPVLAGSDPAAPGRFGTSVSISGDTIVASSPNQLGTTNGRVDVFTGGSGNWMFQTNFIANAAAAGDDFGDRVSVHADLLAIQAPHENAVYIFERTGTGWVFHDRLTGIYNPAYGSFPNLAWTGPWLAAGSPATNEVLVFTAYNNPASVAAYVRDLLYYPDAAASGAFDPEQTAFRYKTLLYAEGTNGALAQFTNIANLYGPAEQNLADFAEGEVAKGLDIHPDDPVLGNLLLDIYYDRTVAETILANNLLARAEAAHFPTAISGLATPPSGFVIDNEIPLYEEALATNRYALESYFSLFTNTLGVDTTPPLGYQIFANLVPTRGLMPASYLDTNGVLQSVTSNNAALFTGYKDLTLLFNQLQNYGETADTLGKLLLAQDSTRASNVVSSAQQLLFLNGTLLKSMFATLPGTNDSSGLAQSIDGWSDSLSTLTTLQQNLIGGANLLGFAPDFMLFVYTLPGGTTYHSSYDALHDYLLNNAQSPLLVAENKLAAAEASYATYREGQSQLADQMTRLDQTYVSRLRDIVGAFPGDPGYSDNPTNNPGSLLDQQYEIIQQAQLKIRQNQTEMANLNQRVQIELDRASSVSNVMINYGNEEASVEDALGNIQAAQAAADQLSSYFDPANLLSGASIAIGLNAGVQAGSELAKADLEAQKARSAALEQAQITGINSAATIKTMLLNMNTLVVESQEDALQLQQALNQLSGLYREKQQLEQKIAQQDASLAPRYYADPSHRLLAQSDMVAADMAFNDAQKWLFFTERALAYKWNTPFDHLYDGITWTENTLFKLRNADELQEYFNAMNDWDALADASDAATQTNTDYFSVRDDFFGYPLTNSLGQTLTYPDPITGQMVGAIQAFRDRLRQLQVTASTANGPYSYIDLHFSTVRQIPGKAFFEGPIFSTNGTVLQYGLALDKIQGITINLPGTVGGTYVQGQLVYGGTSFIRNLAVGTYNPAQPDMLANEMTAYSTRHWYYSLAEDTWTSDEAQTASVNLELTTQAGVEPAQGQIATFNERSVAASDWELQIPTYKNGSPEVTIDQLDDIEIWFKHSATDRY